MSEELKGVFVRFPLSDEVLAEFNSNLRIEDDIKRDIAHLGGVECGLLAIGTPVTGGDVAVVDYSEYEPKYHDNGMGCGLEDRGINDRYEAMGYGWDQAMERVCSEFPETVLLSDHLAKLAERDAEIARLRECYEASEAIFETGVINSTPEMFRRKDRSNAALKGTEA